MNEVEATHSDIGHVLEKMSEAVVLTSHGSPIRYEIETKPRNGYPGVLDQMRVIEFLRLQHAIHITSSDRTGTGYIGDFLGGGKGITFEKISPTFETLCKKYPVEKEKRLQDISSEYWIVRDKEGNFWFDGNRVYFKNPNGGYAKIFNAVFSLKPYGGDVSYSRIKKIWDKADRDAVLRALSGEKANLYLYVPAIKYMLDFQTPLFDAIPGKGIRFNNKKSNPL